MSYNLDISQPPRCLHSAATLFQIVMAEVRSSFITTTDREQRLRSHHKIHRDQQGSNWRPTVSSCTPLPTCSASGQVHILLFWPGYLDSDPSLARACSSPWRFAAAQWSWSVWVKQFHWASRLTRIPWLAPLLISRHSFRAWPGARRGGCFFFGSTPLS